jgi:Ca2+-binding EF-hand superfamily protein
MNMSSMMGVGGGRMPDFSAMREKMFNKADGNGDKALSLEEFQAAGKNMPMGKGASAEKTKEAFGKIDSDGNGSLSQEEMSSFGDKMSSQMQGMMIAMQSMMGGGAGGGSGGGQGPDLNAMFGKADGDKNGAISRTEFDQAAKDSPIARLLGDNGDDAFGKIDSDGDGSLSKDEATAFGDAMKEQMKRIMGGDESASSADALQAMNAYGKGGSGKDDLTQTLLKMLDGGKTQGANRDARV